MHIGRIYGSPEVSGSRIDRAIAKLIRLRGAAQVGGLASLDIQFLVPGSLLGLDFSGIRTGKLSKKERMLVLQIAVPLDIVEAGEQEIDAFLQGALREAVRKVTPRFRRAKIPYDEQDFLSVVDNIERRSTH